MMHLLRNKASSIEKNLRIYGAKIRKLPKMKS